MRYQSWINYIILVQLHLQLRLQICQLHYNYSVLKNQITITFALVTDYKLKLQFLYEYKNNTSKRVGMMPEVVPEQAFCKL